MMKKLTKAALLAAATAFMLAGFPACEHDDNNKTEQSGGKGEGDTNEDQGDDEGEEETKINLTYSFKDFTTVPENLDVTLTTNSDGVNIVLLAESCEAFGTTEISANTESNGVTLTNKYKLKNTPAYKTNNNTVGLTIKNACIKITGVTGEVDVVVDWCIASEKDANDRGIFVKVGDTITGQGNAISTKNNNITDPKEVKNKLNTNGTATGDIYIAASNESIIENITITSK